MSEQEEIAAARRELGAQLTAWRVRAGLTQRELARRTGYSRSTIGAAETGRPGSAAFWAASDRELGAGGNLVGWHARTEATVTAIRQQAAQQAQAAQAAQAATARPGAVGGPEAGAVVVQNSPCPNCHHRLRMTTHLITELTVRADDGDSNEPLPGLAAGASGPLAGSHAAAALVGPRGIQPEGVPGCDACYGIPDCASNRGACPL